MPWTQLSSSERRTSAPWPGHLQPALPRHTIVVGRVPLAEPLSEPRHLAAQHLVLAQEAVVLQDQLVLCRARGPLVILLREQLLPVLSPPDRALGPACVANPTRRGELGSATLPQPPQPLPTSAPPGPEELAAPVSCRILLAVGPSRPSPVLGNPAWPILPDPRGPQPSTAPAGSSHHPCPSP